MRSPIGVLNAFLSQSMAVGESADFGSGFYAREGTTNVDRNGPPVYLDVDPEAQEGRDFVFAPDSQTRAGKRSVIWKAGSAVRVRDRQGSANDPLLFLNWLVDAAPGEGAINEWRTQQDRFSAAAAALRGQARERFRQALLTWMDSMTGDDYQAAALWFSTDAAAAYPTAVDTLLRRIPVAKNADRRVLGFVVILALANPRVAELPRSEAWFKKLFALNSGDSDGVRAAILRDLAPLPAWRDRPFVQQWLKNLESERNGPGHSDRYNADMATWVAISAEADRGEDPKRRMAAVLALAADEDAPPWLEDALRHRTWRQAAGFGRFFRSVAFRFGTSRSWSGPMVHWVVRDPALLDDPEFVAGLEHLIAQWLQQGPDDQLLFRVFLSRQPGSRLPSAARWLASLGGGQAPGAIVIPATTPMVGVFGTTGSNYQQDFCPGILALQAQLDQLAAQIRQRAFSPPP